MVKDRHRNRARSRLRPFRSFWCASRDLGNMSLKMHIIFRQRGAISTLKNCHLLISARLPSASSLSGHSMLGCRNKTQNFIANSHAYELYAFRFHPSRSCRSCMALLFATAAQAQLVSVDGATATVTTTINLGTTNLVVGNTGPNTTLVLTNGGNVTTGNVTANDTFSRPAPAPPPPIMSSAFSGSVPSWSRSRRLVPCCEVGNDSAFNKVLIAGGGFVSDDFGVIGFPAWAPRTTPCSSPTAARFGATLSTRDHLCRRAWFGKLSHGDGRRAGRNEAPRHELGVDVEASNNLAVVTGAGFALERDRPA